MEGMNFLGLCLWGLAPLIFAGAALVALVLWIVRRTKAARIVCAAGLLCAAVIAALGALTFLAPRYSRDGDMPVIVLMVLSLFLAGVGQFVAALQSPRTYAAAFGCAAGSMAMLCSPLLESDSLQAVPGVHVVHQVFALHSLSLPGVTLGLALSLLLAVLSLMIAVLPPRRTRAGLLVRQSAEGVHAEPLAGGERPREPASSSDKIKPA